MRIPRFFSSSKINSLSLFIIYTLTVSLFAPFAIRRVEAVPAAKTINVSASKKASAPVTAKAQEQKARWRDGELLVHFREHAPSSKLNALLRANGAQWNGQLRGESGIERLTLSKSLDPEIAAATLRTSEWVDFAEPNYLITADQTSTQTQTQTTPNDPRYPEQEGLKNTVSSKDWAATTGSNRTVIAVVDSGIDFTHPDLNNNEWDNTLEQANDRDNDGNGFTSDLHGWDFITNSSGIIDEQGHGSAIAGIIAARGNNAIGISGVMWQASLMNLRVLDSTGTGDVAHAVEAIDYAVNNGAQVINCSWGSDDASLALREAIDRAARRGAVVVTSAGNQARDIETTPRYPASFDLPNLISVASTDSNDLLTSFSNWGMTHISIAAPGQEILTTKGGGDYRTISGTSASAAFVAGVVGLIKTLRPWLGADRTRELILRGARQVASLSDKVSSKGIVSTAGTLETLDTIPASEGLDESIGNNGGEHGNNGNGRRTQPNNRPDGSNINSNRDGHEFSVTPPARTQGAPGLGLPDLDLLRRQQPASPKAAPAVPSTRCSHHDPDCLSVKRQAALESPADLLAWSINPSSMESLDVEHSRIVSDTPFKLVWIPQPLLAATPPLQPQTTRINVALASNGGVATASSTTPDSEIPGYEFHASAVNDGDRAGLTYPHNGFWRDGTANTYPDWVEVAFNGNQTIDEIDVISVQDNIDSVTPIDPTETQTFTQSGITAFDVQYWNGSAWATVWGGSVTGNNKVWRKFAFSAVTTSKVRVLVNNAQASRSRLVELEAWGTPSTFTNVALAANGGVATASSTALDSEIPGYEFHTSSANDGDRAGLTYPHNGFWRDATASSYPDWLQIAFNGSKTISEIDVFTLQDNIDTQTPSAPTQTMAFTQSGITEFDVQYWNGTSWVTIPGGSVTGNNKVWRKFSFAAATTDKIRVLVNNALNSRSRIVEVEAWEGTTGSSTDPSDNNYSTARLDPVNQTGTGGVDLLSGNINWSLPVLGLKGRAGLDLGLSLSYNSLVWTKDTASNSIKFDADQGSPSPGFRLGFPVIQLPYYDSQVGKYAYLLITPSGSHTELRQVGASNTYESADSSYLQLIDNGSSLTLRPTDGSQLTYELKNGQYQCTQVKDRNGNYISVSYYTDGRINTITDTLSRVITFNYDTYLNLISITQDWGGVSHQWATFGWSNLTVNPGFSGMTVVGPQNNTSIPVLTQVSFSDGSRYNFEYNSYGQVYLVRHYAADNHPLSYSFYTLPASTTDCPRVTNQSEWAENWNNNQEAMTAYTLAADHSFGQVTMPDNTVYKELYATSGWSRGLTTGAEFWSAPTPTEPVSVMKKWTTTSYTQDDTGLPYQKNPRVTETNIYDSEGKHKRTTLDYGPGTGSGIGQYAKYGLPYIVREYDADGVTILRETYTDYNLSQTYLDQRIIGLVSAKYTSNGSQWQTKTGYFYDAGSDQLQATASQPTQHDAAYDTGFTTRGNVTSIARYDVTDINNDAKRLITQVGYDTDGSVIFTRDPLWQAGQPGHQANISYLDDFSVGAPTSTTYAYPTKVTPPLGLGETAESFSSTTKYNYYFGAVTYSQGPAPDGQIRGAIQTFEYDDAGRISKVNNFNNGAYKRWVYDPSGAVKTYALLKSGAPEAYSVTVFDGAGRVRATAADLPNSTGLYRGQFTYYDVMGRVSQASNPGEMTSGWVPTGDDAAGWVWTQQAYDWKGRPTLTTLPSTDGGQTSPTKLITYGGCGCAGGEVVTIRDEVGRYQRMTADPLGRAWKSEVLNQDGTTVYSTSTNTYNARDQITSTIEQVGSSGTSQTTTLTYDGYGRLKTQLSPAQTTATQYNYNTDDSVHDATDGRGVTTTFTYNNRNQVTNISYAAPTGITPTGAVTIGYDAAGNRTSMTDGSGSVTYQYDQLSRLTSETRQFTELTNTYTLSYAYNLGGELTSITDPTGAVINYSYDQTGRMTDVTGTTFGGVTSYATNMQYRAWGAVKHLSYGNNLTLDVGYNSRLEASSFVIPNVLNKTYQYNADGMLNYSHDVIDSHLDRAYAYDHAGRLTQALSGAEARGGGATDDRPYKESFGYDAFGHLTSQSTNHWVASYSTADTYQNDRNTNTGWQYDADGRLLYNPDVWYNYDAAGQAVTIGTESIANESYDGDGRPVKSIQTSEDAGGGSLATTTYYVRSSMLGGAVLTELTGSGGKQRTFVYANGSVLAWQQVMPNSGTEVVSWEHRDASNASFRTSDITGNTGGVTTEGQPSELDPLNANMGRYNPYLNPLTDPDEGHNSWMPYPSFSDPRHLGTAYSAYGMTVTADFFMSFVESGLVGGRLGLVERSALTQTYRWVQRGTLTITDHRESPNPNAIMIGTTVTLNLGYWQPTSLSYTTTSSLVFAGTDLPQDPQDPVDRIPGASIIRQQSPKGPCPPDKRRFFDWLVDPLRKMAQDLNTTLTLLLTHAAKEAGWNNKYLDHNQPLNNPFGVNNISKGKAVGNASYPSLDAAIDYYEKRYARLRGAQTPEDFINALERPAHDIPFNSDVEHYTTEYMKVYNTMLKFMKLCGIQ